MIHVILYDDWSTVFKSLTVHKANLPKRVRKVAKAEASFLLGKIREAFKTQGTSNGQRWEPNAPTTLETKKSRTTLKNTGRLRKSVKLEIRDNEFFVGVPNGAKSLDGEAMTRIAERMEYGEIRTLRVTPAMYTAVISKIQTNGKYRGSGRGDFRPGNSVVIRVPARSFLRATYEVHMKSHLIDRRLYDEMKDYQLY